MRAGKTVVPFVVQSPPGTIPKPPPELGEAGAALWRSILQEWSIEGAGELATLAEACSARDTAERLRKQIAIDGDMIETGTGSSKVNPAIMVEISARALCARLISRLGLLDSGPKKPPGRPPKVGGW